MSSGNVIELKDDDHHQDLLVENLLQSTVVYIFSAPWCGPCKTFKTVWKDAAEKYPDVKFVYVNIDNCVTLADEQGISHIPAVRIAKSGSMYTVNPTREKLFAAIETAIN